jgi:integrase
VDQWSADKGKAIGKTAEVSSINEYIEHIRLQIYEFRMELESKNKEVTALAVKNKFYGISEDRKYIVALFKEHNENCRMLVGSGLSEGTAVKYECCLRHLQTFIRKYYKTDDLLLSEVNHKFIKDFEVFLRTKDIGKCNNNTTVKYIKNFKKIILYALANGWLTMNPFANIKYHIQDVDIAYLEEEELKIICEKAFGNERLERIRDVFVFCCYTGMAFGDVKRLQDKHIVKKAENDHWLIKNREKTNITFRVPLLPAAIKILDKYKNDPACLEKQQLLPVPTNQKMNAYLKEISEVCGLNKVLHSHCARHTFATTVTLANDIPMEVVSKMLGHTSINMTKKYARIIDKQIENSMKKIREKY